MATAYTGVTGNGGTNGTGTATTTSMSVTSGNTLVAVCRGAGSETLSSSNCSNDGTAFTWTLIDSYITLNISIGVWTAPITATQSCAVTFNPPAVSGRCGIICFEFSGMGTYGTVEGVGNGSGTTITSASFTPAAAAGVVIAGVVSSQTTTWEADYTTNNQRNGTGRVSAAYDLAPAASSQAVDATQASDTWDVAGWWFDDAAVGGGDVYSGRGVGRGIARGVYR